MSNRMGNQLQFGFQQDALPVSTKQMDTPGGYRGIYRLHKYWGKKPHEPLAFLIEQLTDEGDVVVDPFCGSGVAGRQALLRSRRFVGFDINPVAVELTRLLLHPPDPVGLAAAIADVEREAREPILQSYLLSDGSDYATHYLWDADDLSKVLVSGNGRQRQRLELEPSDHDRELSRAFSTYRSKHIRDPRFFKNSRINAAPDLTLSDLLTGRAQRNLDLLIDAIDRCPPDLALALKLCLTAASGQMTKMVFAVTGRGKTNGKKSDKIEVGSWVIGYWRPRLHFEVNAWNCFAKRTSEMLKAFRNDRSLAASALTANPTDVVTGNADAAIECGDCRRLLSAVPDNSVALVLTDPPHSDRIPYLELSELWNSILGRTPEFESEIVISNAKERGKTPVAYCDDLATFLSHVPRVLRPDGVLLLLFNARLAKQWQALRQFCAQGDSKASQRLYYLGQFPCAYSAGSVVQDNRRGSLKHDVALVFARNGRPAARARVLGLLEDIRGWSPDYPAALRGARG
jgi:SAM-dependent methyltransferase